MCSSWGTCHGGTWRWQDILNVGKLLKSGGVQGRKRWRDGALTWPEQLVVSWPTTHKRRWGTAVGLPRWRGALGLRVMVPVASWLPQCPPHPG